MFGSVSGEVAARTYCPVATVWGTQPDTTKPELVLGLEFDEDPAPIDFAFHTAARLGLDLRAVRAFQPASAYDGDYVDDVEVGRKDAMIGMGTLLCQIREQYPEVPITFEADYGDPATVLHAAARDARLLVVGSHRRRGGPAPRLGGTARLAHAPRHASRGGPDPLIRIIDRLSRLTDRPPCRRRTGCSERACAGIRAECPLRREPGRESSR
jgi:nucleotide-binding universal stress UspA family protein